LYGWHAVMAALANPLREKHKVILSNPAQKSVVTQCGTEVLEARQIQRILPPGSVHQGIALLTRPLPQPDLHTLLARVKMVSRLVVLDQVTDPHNIGAIMRSAAAFQADAVIVQEKHSPAETPVMVKSASGGFEKVSYIPVINLARTLEDLKQAGYWCLGFDADGSRNVRRFQVSDKCALVFGAEGAGLRRLVKENCDASVHLPVAADFKSLNVSNAVAVALYEAYCQKSVG
jgi:23S rRNA (guanosine2251-2'-O)-methyltransferase